MTPSQTGARYDRIAEWWGQRHAASGYGVAQLERSISFVPEKGRALDVGCGSSGRFMGVLLDHGFETEGMDASPQMISLAREVHPNCEYHIADIATWKLPRRYDLISAWDSTFHLPLDLQEPALRTMCEGLKPGGVLIFTCGGKDEASSISGEFQGEDFEYSSLGLSAYLQLIAEFGCVCRHLEYDQGPVETHVYIIAQKIPRV
jgi:SAM-dependent methyltransferase